MTNYKLTVKHDNGKFTVKTSARDEAAAVQSTCAAYGCPESAIVKIQSSPVFYKVVKIFRVSCRRQILARNLSEQEAQRVVNSYPDSSRSMVVYINQNKW